MKKLVYILLLLYYVPLQAQQGKPVYTRQVYFEFGKYNLRPDDNRTFIAFLRAVKAQGEGYAIRLTGHTDNVDSDPYNDKLGMNRAKTVRDYLIGKGIPAESITITSKGEKVAVKDNTSDTGRALNRRVEMILYGGNGVVKTQTEEAIKLKGTLYDAQTQKPIQGTIMVAIQDAREMDRDKIKSHKQTTGYEQGVIKDRTYNVYATAEGYRAGSHLVTVAADAKGGTITQDIYLEKLTIRRRVSYEKIYFVPDKDEFMSTAHEDLQRLLDFMQHDTTKHVEIRGHINYTLNRPPMSPMEEQIFYDLSLRRAKAVYNFLITSGINKNRMSYRGMSNTEMVIPYARTLEEAQRNMRVEVLVLN